MDQQIVFHLAYQKEQTESLLCKSWESIFILDDSFCVMGPDEQFYFPGSKDENRNCNIKPGISNI